MIEKITRFILNGCYGDCIHYIEYSKKKGKEIPANNSPKQWSYIVELLIITIKSLIPSNETSGTVIDYKRFNEEIRLWEYYRHGENESTMNILRDKKEKIYWENKDDSVYSRIVPITIANSAWDVAKREVTKNVIYTTGNIETLFESILLSRIMHELLSSNSISCEEIIINLKEQVINFSQVDFLNEYKKEYAVDFESYPGNYRINFERCKIDLLNSLNNIHEERKYIVLSATLKMLEQESISSEQLLKNFYTYGLYGFLNKILVDEDIKDKDFLEGLSNYLLKLRKSRISPESVAISKYSLPDIFTFKEGEEFFHSLLNKCKVIKREDRKSAIISYIETKSGVYRFFKIISDNKK